VAEAIVSVNEKVKTHAQEPGSVVADEGVVAADAAGIVADDDSA